VDAKLMYKMNHVKIGGFRRLKDLDLSIRPFMVLIGANGVGKTSFLDAYSLLSASAAGGLNSKLSQFGGCRVSCSAIKLILYRFL